MRVGVHVQGLTVSRDDLGREHGIDRHPELADEVADPATERDPADADGPGIPEADRQAVLTERGGDLTGGQAGLAHAVRPATSMSMAFIGDRSMTMPPSVVPCPAALWPPLLTASSMPGLTRDGHDRRDIGGIGDLDDDRRPSSRTSGS